MAMSPWGVVLAQDVPGDAGALLVRLVGVKTHLVHAEEDAAVDRFQASRTSGRARETITDMA